MKKIDNQPETKKKHENNLENHQYKPKIVKNHNKKKDRQR